MVENDEGFLDLASMQVTNSIAGIEATGYFGLSTTLVNSGVIRAFASIGWGWGGRWSGTKDYMHFSATGH